jgi:uncharacterized protein (DUF2235 family)
MATKTPLPIPLRQLQPRPGPAPARIILCLDGTGNSPFMQKQSTKDRANGDGGNAKDFGAGKTPAYARPQVLKPTNVLKMARAVRRWDLRARREQFVYYDSGVGAFASYPGAPNKILRLNDRLWGGLGAGFEGNVEDALHFLTLNVHPKDEVYVFGFSRGAATAQAVTYFLDWCGGRVLAKDDAYYLPLYFRAFLQGRRFDDAVAETLRPGKTLQWWPIQIRFLGLWDTVMALGSRLQARGAKTSTHERSFYMDHRPAQCVQHARHALAIDETRFDFRPEIWQDKHDHQTMKQRWFAGVHSNVGGGYVQDGLANIALSWMVQEAVEQGLYVEQGFLRPYRPFPYGRLYPSHTPFYQFGDWIRGATGRGRRALAGHPGTANLTLDRSVIDRMLWTPDKKGDLPQAYEPQNVLQFLSCLGDGLEPHLRDAGMTANERTAAIASLQAKIPKHKPDCRFHAKDAIRTRPAGASSPMAGVDLARPIR